MGMVEFVWSAMAGGAFYDSVKLILGSSFDKLNTFFEANKRDDFVSHLETILDVSEQIKEQLGALQKGEQININSNNTIIQSGTNNDIKIG